MRGAERIVLANCAKWAAGELYRPLTALAEKPHPMMGLRASVYAYPFSPEQEPRAVVIDDDVADPLALDLAPLCAVDKDYLLDKPTADVLSRFHMGQNTLKQVQVGQVVDGKLHPIPGEWFFLHIGERHETLVPLEKDGMKILASTSTIVHGPVSIEEENIAVGPASVDIPVDIWRDPIWMFGLFMSPRLAQALEEAGLAERWMLTRCRWATPEEEAVRIIRHDFYKSSMEFQGQFTLAGLPKS